MPRFALRIAYEAKPVSAIHAHSTQAIAARPRVASSRALESFTSSHAAFCRLCGTDAEFVLQAIAVALGRALVRTNGLVHVEPFRGSMDPFGS